jgi:glycerol dehydrogenase
MGFLVLLGDKMENYSINLPAYSIGSNVYEKISEICSPYGTKAVVIGGKTAINAVKEQIVSAIENSTITISDFLWYGGEACYENVEILMKNPAVQNAHMLFAVGGGKALDTVKCLGVKVNKPVFTIPTIASNCAPVTCVSIMYSKEGVFKEPFFFSKPPVHTFVNTTVLAKAPYKYMWAGMGDTYAKYFESSVSSRGEDNLVHYHRLGVVISQMCLEPILKYGAKALEDNKNGVSSYEFEQTVLSIVITTGIASIFLTAEHIIDYNTGLAHGIFYALTTYPHIEERHLHGEVVGFGVLILLLVDKQYDMFKRLYAFNESVSLPVSLSDIEISQDNLEDVISKAVLMKDSEHNPYKITKDMLREAFEKLSKYNKEKQ